MRNPLLLLLFFVVFNLVPWVEYLIHLKSSYLRIAVMPWESFLWNWVFSLSLDLLPSLNLTEGDWTQCLEFFLLCIFFSVFSGVFSGEGGDGGFLWLFSQISMCQFILIVCMRICATLAQLSMYIYTHSRGPRGLDILWAASLLQEPLLDSHRWVCASFFRPSQRFLSWKSFLSLNNPHQQHNCLEGNISVSLLLLSFIYIYIFLFSARSKREEPVQHSL